MTDVSNEANPDEWAEPAGTFLRYLNLESEIITAGADSAINLNESQNSWLVLSGSLTVFSVDNQTGTRQPLYRVEAGGLVQGTNLAENDSFRDFHIVGISTNQTKMVPVQGQQLLNAIDTIPDSSAPAELIDNMVVSMLSPLRVALNDPIGARRIDPGTEQEISEDEEIYSEGGVVWIQAPPESVSLGYSDDFSPEASYPDGPELAWVPVIPTNWWRIKKAFQSQVITTAQRLAMGSIETDIAQFHSLIIRIFNEVARWRETMSSDRMVDSEANKGKIFSASLRKLGEVLNLDPGLQSDSTQTPLARATELVCRSHGFELDLEEGESHTMAKAADPIATLADRSGFFSRAFNLDADWWKYDHGAFLAFQNEGKNPVALIPKSNSKEYQLVEPVSGHNSIVDADKASELSGTAYTFFRPLPDQPLGPWALVRLAAFGSRRDIWRIIWLVVLAGFLSLVLPIATGWIMSPVIPNAELSNLQVLSIAVALAGSAGVAFSYVEGIAMLRIEGRMQNIVQTAVWNRILKLPIKFFHAYSVGDLVNRSDGIDQMRSFLTTNVMHSLLHGVTALFSFAFMLYYEWKLSLAALLVVLLYTLVAIPIGFKFINITRRMMKMVGQLQGVVLQLLTALPKLRVAGAEYNAFAQWSKRYGELLTLTYKQRFLNIVLVVTKSVLSVAVTFGIILVLAWQGDVLFALFHSPADWQAAPDKSRMALSTAHFISFNVALGQFIAATFGIAELTIKFLNLTPIYERVKPILEAQEEPMSGADTGAQLIGSVELNEVSFRYSSDSPLILNKVSLGVEPGQFVALVGPSGAGKSTIVRLLLGFEEPESGSVVIDDRDLHEWNLRQLRKKMGVVLQENRLLAGTLFQNIAGGSGISEEEAWEAARLAGIAEDIKAMPMGMETYLGEGASNISGGQRQRITAARALARRPRLIIFDEATSALDNETQRLLTENIARLNATRIVIAHRLSTVIKADRIYVLNDGRIVEAGTFDQLMKQNGFFAGLAMRQLT
jgi:NHLM bacteriocin system ABC transporter ATP-binding protein